MCANADICLVSQPQKVVSIHYHQQTKDPMLLSQPPRFPYPGYPNGVDPPSEQSGDVKIWQIVSCENRLVNFIKVILG